MNLILIKNNLKEGLGIVERASSENPNLPVLKNVLLETEGDGVKLSATNLEIGVTCMVPAKILEKGKTTLPASVLSGLINNIQNDRITLETKGDKLEIKTDNYSASIQTINPEEFPIIPKIKNTNQFISLKNGAFKEGLSQVVVSTQQTDLRPELNGVLLDFSIDSVRLASTDSFRLSEKTLPTNQIETNHQGAFKILIPLKTTQELLRILKDDEVVKIIHDQNQVLFETPRFSVISRLIEGNFPDYSAIVPQKFETQVLVEHSELVNALKLAGVFSSRVSEIKVKVPADKKNLEIFSSEQMVGENNYLLPGKIQGSAKEISFNWRYVLDGLKALGGNEVFWGINEDNKPALLKNPKDDSYFYVLMPILKA